MARDVREIANAVLDAADAAGYRLTNLALNKIVFFAHAWSLARNRRPLVDTEFEAWQYGPVHPQLYRQLKVNKDRPITSRLTRIDLATGRDVPFKVALDRDDRDIVDQVTTFYGRYTAARLVEISHEPGAPWDQIWSSAQGSACPGMLIPDDLIQDFYHRKLARAS